jgi:uncharacterized membrane protein
MITDAQLPYRLRSPNHKPSSHHLEKRLKCCTEFWHGLANFASVGPCCTWYPLVICNIAIENDHRNSGSSHIFPLNMWFSMVFCGSLPEGNFPVMYHRVKDFVWYWMIVVTVAQVLALSWNLDKNTSKSIGEPDRNHHFSYDFLVILRVYPIIHWLTLSFVLFDTVILWVFPMYTPFSDRPISVACRHSPLPTNPNLCLRQGWTMNLFHLHLVILSTNERSVV